VVITADANDSIVLHNVALANLDPENFLFL